MTCTHRPRVEESQGAYGSIVIEAKSPLVKIASGTEAGDAWSLCAYRATAIRNEKQADDALCWEFTWGAGPCAGYTCASDIGVSPPRDSDYFLRASTEPVANNGSAHLGAVTKSVERVAVRPGNGTEIEAPIYEPGSELGVEYDFFVGFAPPGSNPAIVVYDAAGRMLDRDF